jgi:fibro-slime domain-containing protein
MKKSLLLVVALGAATPAAASPVILSLTGTYNTVTSSGTGDFQTECCSSDPGMVTSHLSAGGLPVYSGTSTFPIHDINAVTKEILWWSPGTYNGDVVTASGTGTISTPFSSASMFPPTGSNGNVGNDSDGFLTAEFTGSFSLGTKSSVTFTLGADDDAFFYVDGSLVTGLGGVHGDSPAPTETVTLSAGPHDIELFYADRNQTQAALTFGLDSTGITPVPEVSTWAMMALGFAGLGFAGYRARRSSVSTA